MQIEKFMNCSSQTETIDLYLARLAEASAQTQQRFEELDRRLVRVEQELKKIHEKEARELAEQASARQNAASVSTARNRRVELMNSAARSLQQKRFWWVGGSINKRMMLYDSASKLLWVPPNTGAAWVDVLRAKSLAAVSTVGGLSEWRLPTNREIIDFAFQSINPLRSGFNRRLLNNFSFCTSSNRIDLDDFRLFPVSYSGVVITCNDLLLENEPNQLIQTMIERSWSLCACDAPDTDILRPLR